MRYAMPPSLFVLAVASSLALVLEFDGSLRPPIDPVPGFASACAGVVSLGGDGRRIRGDDRLASCGAAISLRSGVDGSGDDTVIAVGARHLPLLPGTTSADAEYEGLILGLEWLAGALSSRRGGAASALLNDWYGSTDPELVVRGDCRAVIDQMTSRSVPRKTEGKHGRATELIRSIEDARADRRGRGGGRRDTPGANGESRPQGLAMSFERVPREANRLCDALCGLVIIRKQMENVEEIRGLVRSGAEDAAQPSDTMADAGARRAKRKKGRKRGAAIPKSEDHRRALDRICCDPRLCHSSQLALACELACASMHVGDSGVLGELSGSIFLPLSRRWSRVYHGEDATGALVGYALRRIGLGCARLSKEPDSLMVTLREHVLEKHELYDDLNTVLEFCTNGVSGAIKEERALAANSIVRPFVDVSSIVNVVDAGSRRRGLQAWLSSAYAPGEEDSSSIESRGSLWKLTGD